MSGGEALTPPDDLVMICDPDDVAHVWEDGQGLCGARWLLSDDYPVVELLSARWWLLSNPQYRFPPATACEACVAAALRPPPFPPLRTNNDG